MSKVAEMPEYTEVYVSLITLDECIVLFSREFVNII